MKLRISTPYGNSYIVNEKQQIIRTDQEGFQPSEQWIFVGLSHVKRNELIPYARLIERLSNGEKIKTCWKNGNPQYTVRDIDHGTMRQWGNTKYHGVKYISLEK